MITEKNFERFIDDGTFDNDEPADFDDFCFALFDKKFISVDGIMFVFVDGYSGGEGGGSEVWVVFHPLGEEDNLLRVQGYYSSYGGTEWSEYGVSVESVEAEQVVVTRYVRKKKSDS